MGLSAFYEVQMTDYLNLRLDRDLPRSQRREFFDDFDNYTAADWTITETGTGTRAVQNETGGVLKITNGASDDDANFLQWSGNTLASTAETWKFVTGKPLYFGARVKLSDATQSDFVFGLQITDTTPLAVSDGVYFRKDDGDAYLDFVVIKDSTASTATAAYTMDTSYHNLEAYYDGGYYFTAYVDGVAVAKLALTNMVDDEELSLSFGIQNGEAVAKSLSIDWIWVIQQR